MELNEFKKPPTNLNNQEKKAIEFENVRCSWCLDANQDTLKNITLTIEPRKLTTVIGQVGAGKVYLNVNLQVTIAPSLRERKGTA